MVWFSSPAEMSNRLLDRIIREIDSDVEGQLGFWQFQFAGVRLMCITDESHDRMRVMAAIASAEELSNEQVTACMSANFDRALDARYCIHNDTLWGAFLHPLRSLDEQLFRSACRQVSELAKNFGGTYCSGELIFNPESTE